VAGRFRFRLESLLKLRKSLEEQAQLHLARMILLRDEAREALVRLQESHTQAIESRVLQPGEAVDLQLWKAIERWLFVLERRVAQAEAALQEAETRVLDSQKALTRAHQAQLMLVRLKERRQAQHTLEAQLEESKLADELAVLRYRFNAPSGGHLAREARP
jgi:flagellar export protein FliJ